MFFLIQATEISLTDMSPNIGLICWNFTVHHFESPNAYRHRKIQQISVLYFFGTQAYRSIKLEKFKESISITKNFTKVLSQSKNVRNFWGPKFFEALLQLRNVFQGLCPTYLLLVTCIEVQLQRILVEIISIGVRRNFIFYNGCC